MAEPIDNYGALAAILDRLTDSQAELAGLRPSRDIRPNIVSYNGIGALQLTASQTQNIMFPIGGSDKFICTEIRFTAVGSVLMNLRPSTMPEDFSTGPFHSYAAFGPQAAPMPLILARPWLMDPATVVRVDLTDLSAAINPFAFALVGFRVKT